MRLIEEAVRKLCLRANTVIRADVLELVKRALRREKNKNARWVMDLIVKNAAVARSSKFALCQDTGMVAVNLEVGQGVKFEGSLERAVQAGVSRAYKKGCFRTSVVKSPLVRKNTSTNTPAIINCRLIPGKRIKIALAVRGFGCENISAIRMLKPTQGAKAIKEFVVSSVGAAGAAACPPYLIGLGIGGTLEKAVMLSRQAVLLRFNRKNPTPYLARLEKEILKSVNRLNIGAMGVGGKTTTLGVNILEFPTHIAGLPVAVYISCHALRSASTTL